MIKISFLILALVAPRIWAQTTSKPSAKTVPNMAIKANKSNVSNKVNAASAAQPVKRASSKPPRRAARKLTMGEFRLVWSYSDFPLQIRVAEIPISWLDRTGETKVIDDLAELRLSREILDGKVKVVNGKTQMLAMFVQNTTDKPVAFVVSPHHTEPAKAAIGFQFKCLCYGHTYVVPPGKFWYRIGQLSPAEYKSPEPITLVHDVAGVKVPVGAVPSK